MQEMVNKIKEIEYRNAMALEAIGAHVPVNGYTYEQGVKINRYNGWAYMNVEDISKKAGAWGVVKIDLQSLAIHPNNLSVKGDWSVVRDKLHKALLAKLNM